MRVQFWKISIIVSLFIVLAGCGVVPTTAPTTTQVASILAPSVEANAKPKQPVATGLTLSIEPQGLLFTARGQKQTARVVARDAQGKVVKLKKNTVTWRVSDPLLVKISPKSEDKDDIKVTASDGSANLESQSEREEDEANAISVKSLTDQGLAYLRVELTSNSTVQSPQIPVEIHRLQSNVQVFSSSQIVVSPLEAGPGGGFSANEIANARSVEPSWSAVIRSKGIAVGTLLNLERPNGSLGRVTASVQRGAFTLVTLGVAGMEDLYAPFSFSLTAANSFPASPPLKAMAGPIVPVNGFSWQMCSIIEGPKSLELSKIFDREDFKWNSTPIGEFKLDKVNRKVSFYGGVKFNPTGTLGLNVEKALIGEKSFKIKLRCSLDSIPKFPFVILIPTPAGAPVPIPTFFQVKPNVTITIDASDTPNLRLGLFLMDDPVAIQIGGTFSAKSTYPFFEFEPLPFLAKTPGGSDTFDPKQFVKKFTPDWSFGIGLFNGFITASAKAIIEPISANIAWYFDVPGAPIDFVNFDVTILKTDLAWASGPYAAQSKSGSGRRNVSYLSGEIKVDSVNLNTFANRFDGLPKFLVKKALEAISKTLSVKVGQNFGEANYVPLKPGDLSTGGLPVSAAALVVTTPDGTATPYALALDGATKATFKVGDKLSLLVQPTAGDPEAGQDLLNAAGVKLSVSYKVRYNSLPTVGSIWDYTNRELVSLDGKPGPYIPFTFNNKKGLQPKSVLTFPGDPPNVLPDPSAFQLYGILGTTTVTEKLCNQISDKGGEVEWRFTAENPLISALTSSSYVGGAMVSCGRPILISFNPPTITAKDASGNDMILGNGVTTITVPVCPSDLRTFELKVGMSFNPNENFTPNAWSISGMQLVVGSKTVGSVTYPDGSRPYGDKLNGKPEFVTTDATVTSSVVVSETTNPANKMPKDYVKNVKIDYVAKPTSECPPPISGGGTPTAYGSGDVHFQTLDGQRYDYHEPGEFVFARSALADMPFEVQGRYLGLGGVSITTAVAARVGTDRIGVYVGSGTYTLLVNGKEVSRTSPVNMSLTDGGTLTVDGNLVKITWRDGSNLGVLNHAIGSQDAILQMGVRQKGYVRGLVGNYNGNPNDDWIARDGTPVVLSDYSGLYGVFGKSWRVPQTESLFDYLPNQNTGSFTGPNPNVPPPAVVIDLSAQAAAEQACRNAGVTDPTLLKNCVFDVIVTKETRYATNTAQLVTAITAPPPPPPPPSPSIQIITSNSTLLQVGETVTLTAKVLNSSASPVWSNSDPKATLTLTPGDPFTVTFRSDLPGCYVVNATLSGTGSTTYSDSTVIGVGNVTCGSG
jgi:hypothetical protein